MELNHHFNFNDPIEATEIFRYKKSEKDEHFEEFGSKASFLWEDVMFIKDYPFTDDWKKYIGPKYYVKLRNYSENLLILGDYDEIIRYWAQFRNSYPLFVEPPEE